MRQQTLNFLQNIFWPPHPDEILIDDKTPLMSLYHGAAGVIWGLKQLEDFSYGNIKNNYYLSLDTARQNHKESMESIFLRERNLIMSNNMN